MIVCVCKAISDRHIHRAVKGGATHIRDLTRDLGVGTCCGKCLPEAKAALSAALNQNCNTAPAFLPPTGTEFAV
jgi:bacterioferritin-associated ferredoxin